MFVFAKSLQTILVLGKTWHYVNGEILLTRRKSRKRPCALFSVALSIVIFSKSDDAGAPKYWYFIGNLLHCLQQSITVIALVLILYPIYKFFDTLSSRFGF